MKIKCDGAKETSQSQSITQHTDEQAEHNESKMSESAEICSQPHDQTTDSTLILKTIPINPKSP